MIGKLGDRIVVESEHVGQEAREGEIVDVIEHPSGLLYRIRWRDGQESLYRSSFGSARIVPAVAARAHA